MLKKYKRDKVKKSLFMFVANQRGSLVGVIMALGLLGVAATGLFTYIQHFHKTSTQTAEQINFNPQFLTKVIGNMRSVLVDAQKDPAGVSEKGICALIETSSGLKIKKSVEIVRLDMTKLSSSVLNWNKFFPGPPPNGEWEEVQSSDTVAINRCKEVSKNFSVTDPLVTDLMKCFDYKGAKEQGNKIYVVAQILPKEFPSNNDASSNNNLEARHAIFHLKASIGMVPFEDGSGSASKIVYSSTRSDILWANSAGSCAMAETCTVDADCTRSGATCGSGGVCSLQSPKVVKLSISSMMSTADEGISNAKVEADDTCAGLTIGELKPYATQGGKVEVGTNWVSKDKDSPVYMACVMKKFRCKSDDWVQSDTSTFFDEGMHFTFQLNNDTGRPVTITKMNPTLQGPGINDYPAIAVYSLAPDHPFEVIEGGADEGKFKKITGISPYPSLFKEDSVDPNKLTLNIPPGGGQFRVMVRGNEACSATNTHCAVYNVCDGVCQRNENNWYPEVKITVDDPKLGTCIRRPIPDYSANNIECISCFAKSCHRMGQGTVGMRDTMPQEALDSQLPECRAAGAGTDHENSRKIASSNTFQGNNTNQNVANNSGGCIALDFGGNLSNLDGDFKSKAFEQKACATNYPVLCYANGRYQPATEWNSTTQAYELKEASYDDAEKACYEMGKEVLNKLRLEEYIGGVGAYNPEICSGANCEFVNNATRGMFFLPTYDVGEIFNKNLLSGERFMWVAAELDQGGLVVAAPLKADIGSGATEDYALFNRKESGENYDPVLLKEDNILNVGTTGDPYALVYSVKYKGLIKRPKTTTLQLRFVCQKNNSASTFFLTTSTATFCNGSVMNGPAKCADKDGYFVAPESALDYSRAMMLLKDASNPDPTAETNDEYAVPVDSLGTAVNYVHTQSVTDSVQAWVAVGNNVTCP